MYLKSNKIWRLTFEYSGQKKTNPWLHVKICRIRNDPRRSAPRKNRCSGCRWTSSRRPASRTKRRRSRGRGHGRSSGCASGRAFFTDQRSEGGRVQPRAGWTPPMKDADGRPLRRCRLDGNQSLRKRNVLGISETLAGNTRS